MSNQLHLSDGSIFFSLIFIFAIVFPSCSTKRTLTFGHHEFISIGSLGGFAGSYLEYRIYPDGSAFKRTKFNGDFQAQKKIDQEQVDQFYVLINGLNKEDSINQPGNMSYFIKWAKNNKTIFEVIWDGSDLVDSRIRTLYKIMRHSCIDDNPTR